MTHLHQGSVRSTTIAAIIIAVWLGGLPAKGDNGSTPPSQQAIDERNDRIDPTGLRRALSRVLNDQKLQPNDKIVAAVKVIAYARKRFDPNFNPNDHVAEPLPPPNYLDNRMMSPGEIAKYEDANWKNSLKVMWYNREWEKRKLYKMLVKETTFYMSSPLITLTDAEIADVMNQVSAPPDMKREIQADVFDAKPIPN